MSVRRAAVALTTALALSAALRGVAAADDRDQFIDQWRCRTFKLVYYLRAVPMVKNPRNADLVGVPAGLDAKLTRTSAAHPGIAYDRGHRIAYSLDSMDTPVIVRPAAPPRFPVVRADLSGIRLRSGIAVGTSASTVVSILGKPSAQQGCGSEFYTYATGPMHASLLLTLRHGRVVAIDFFGDD